MYVSGVFDCTEIEKSCYRMLPMFRFAFKMFHYNEPNEHFYDFNELKT